MPLYVRLQNDSVRLRRPLPWRVQDTPRRARRPSSVAPKENQTATRENAIIRPAHKAVHFERISQPHQNAGTWTSTDRRGSSTLVSTFLPCMEHDVERTDELSGAAGRPDDSKRWTTSHVDDSICFFGLGSVGKKMEVEPAGGALPPDVAPSPWQTLKTQQVS